MGQPQAPRDQFRPSLDELCAAVLFGQLEGEPPLRLDERDETTRAAIERLIAVALERGPVWVAYSGGRDSSALLAVAAHVARREGLPLPIPITMTFPGIPEADEEDWQRLVLDHLGLTDQWVPLRLTDDLELIGRQAQRVLRTHGVLLPPNAHAFLPMIDAMAPGDTIISGGTGDELLEGAPQRITSAIISRQRIPRNGWQALAVNDLPRVFLPRAMRRHSFLLPLFWLRAPTFWRLVRHEIDDRAAFPIRFDRLLERSWTDRYFRSGAEAVGRTATDAGVRLLQPFAEHDVVAAFARDWGARWPGGRTRSLTRLVGDLLPMAILERESKAEFVDAFFGAETRAWVANWDGSGVDPARVDIDRLRGVWESELPHYSSVPLLHRAWLLGEGLPTGLPEDAVG